MDDVACSPESAVRVQPRLTVSSPPARKTDTTTVVPPVLLIHMTGRVSSPVADGCDLAAKTESCSSAAFSTRRHGAGGDDDDDSTSNISLCHPGVRPSNNPHASSTATTTTVEVAGVGVDSTNDNTHQHGDEDDGGSGDDEDWFKIVDMDITEVSAGRRQGGATTPTTGTKTATPPAVAKQSAGPGKNQRLPAFNFSFAMGGWLMFYTFGVAKCLLDHGLHNVRPTEQSVIGSSAGSLAAAALVLEADIDKASNECCVRTNTACYSHMVGHTPCRLNF